MTAVAIIPARGGSKRIPRKNIREFCGRPIIAYSIDAAKASGCFSRILVSTDDLEIADVAIEHGAEVPFMRPPELSDDFTGTSDVVAHALQWLRMNKYPAEYACCMYATAPFIQIDMIKEAYRLLLRSEKSYVFPVTQYDFPVQRALRLGPDNNVSMFYPQYEMTRSQDLEATWHDVGQFYWGTVDAYLDSRPVFSEQSIGLPIPSHLALDIDTEEDWIRAEIIFNTLEQTE